MSTGPWTAVPNGTRHQPASNLVINEGGTLRIVGKFIGKKADAAAIVAALNAAAQAKGAA